MKRAPYYLALLPNFSQTGDADQLLHMEMLRFFDDRCWPVRVFYHDRLPRWICANWLAAHMVYGFRLFFSSASTMIVDYSLFPYLILDLFWSRMIGGRKIIVSVNGKIGVRRGRVPWLYRMGLRVADLILADSRPTLEALAAAGIPASKLRVLPRGPILVSDEPWVPAFAQPASVFCTLNWKKTRRKFGQIIATLAQESATPALRG